MAFLVTSRRIAAYDASFVDCSNSFQTDVMAMMTTAKRDNTEAAFLERVVHPHGKSSSVGPDKLCNVYPVGNRAKQVNRSAKLGTRVEDGRAG